MDRNGRTIALLCASVLICLASRAPVAAATTTEVVPDPTLPGLAVNGAVFISEGKGGGFGRCSGTSVNAPNMSVVVTAGHCVYEEGHFYGRKWVFVPGYRYGERPFGTFRARWLGTTPQWQASQNFNYDVGMAVVGRNERGQRLAAAVGGDEIAWGLPPRQSFDVYGYPVARPFTGATLERCLQAPVLGHDYESFFMPGPLDLGVSCEVSPGSSGGGWAIHGNVLNGVTSNGYGDDPRTDYGPYFGREVGRLYRRAAAVR
jgi:V8-like Glu-specific endopeptidase